MAKCEYTEKDCEFAEEIDGGGWAVFNRPLYSLFQRWNMEKEELQGRIDDEKEEMTDKEKRDTYRAEIASQSDYEDWCDRGGTR